MCVFDKVSTFYRLLIWSISYSSTITRKGLQQRKPWYPSLAHIHEEKFIHFYNTSYFKTRLCWKYLFLYMFAGSSIFQSGKKLWEQQVKFSIATRCAKVHVNDPLAELVRWAQVAPPLHRGVDFRLGATKIPAPASAPKHMEGPACSRVSTRSHTGNSTGNSIPM